MEAQCLLRQLFVSRGVTQTQAVAYSEPLALPEPYDVACVVLSYRSAAIRPTASLPSILFIFQHVRMKLYMHQKGGDLVQQTFSCII